MKILIINTLYEPNIVGGAEISVQIHAESLAQKGIDTVVATLCEKKYERKNINGVKIYYIPIGNIYWPFNGIKNDLCRFFWHVLDIYNPIAAKQIKKIIQKEKPDIIHTNNLSGFSISVWNIAKYFNVPVIHTIRDHYLLCHLSTMYRKNTNCNKQCYRCRLFSFPKKYFSSIPKCVVGISNYILSRHLSYGFFKSVYKACVIPNSYQGIKKSIYKNREKTLRLGYLGRISKEKGIFELLQNFRGKGLINLEFHIAGTGPAEAINHLKRNLFEKVHYHEYLAPYDFFKMIDLLVVPSQCNESFGRTVIEAFSYGIPVIGTKRGGIPELITNGKTGFLYEPDDPGSLFESINKFMTHPMLIKTMEKECLAQSEKYQPAAITEKYIKTYEILLS